MLLPGQSSLLLQHISENLGPAVVHSDVADRLRGDHENRDCRLFLFDLKSKSRAFYTNYFYRAGALSDSILIRFIQ